MKRLLFILTLLFFCISCEKDLGVKSYTGIVKDAGITTYMYGSYTLVSDEGKTLYALTSSAVNLHSYINSKVEIEAKLIEGYPIDGGPEFLDVKTIKVVK